MKEAHDHHRVSPEGRELGAQIVRMTEPMVRRLAQQGEPDERCRSCAFRAGTVPNGCFQTQMDVLKAVVERTPFACHQGDRRGHLCHGWYAAQVVLAVQERTSGQKLPITKCPWDFSPPDEPVAGTPGVPGTSTPVMEAKHG